MHPLNILKPQHCIILLCSVWEELRQQWLWDNVRGVHKEDDAYITILRNGNDRDVEPAIAVGYEFARRMNISTLQLPTIVKHKSKSRPCVSDDYCQHKFIEHTQWYCINAWERESNDPMFISKYVFTRMLAMGRNGTNGQRKPVTNSKNNLCYL